ncbi:hypothetical protein BH10PSE1_BH10PSE1_21520 [soil metagenome]
MAKATTKHADFATPVNRPEPSFEEMTAFWARHVEAEDADFTIAAEPDFPPLTYVERRILSTYPTTAFEMIVMLELIADSAGEGNRSDGLEFRAIRNLQHAIAHRSGDPELLAFYASFRAGSAYRIGAPSPPAVRAEMA